MYTDQYVLNEDDKNYLNYLLKRGRYKKKWYGYSLSNSTKISMIPVYLLLLPFLLGYLSLLLNKAILFFLGINCFLLSVVLSVVIKIIADYLVKKDIQCALKKNEKLSFRGVYMGKKDVLPWLHRVQLKMGVKILSITHSLNSLFKESHSADMYALIESLAPHDEIELFFTPSGHILLDIKRI